MLPLRACATGFVLAMLAPRPPGAGATSVFRPGPFRRSVPATPGGPVDTAVRLIEPALASALGSSVVLIKQAGAPAATLGMQAVASAAPDGYTIGQGVNSIFTITRISGTHVPFTLDDLQSAGNYVTDVSVLAVSADANGRRFDDVVAYARPIRASSITPQPGSAPYRNLSMEALAHKFRLNMVAVPFPGGAQLTTAILGKQIDIGMVPYTTGAAMFKANKLRPLLTTAPERLRQLPGIPTFADKGITENGLNLIMGLYAPALCRYGLRDTLTDAVAKAARDPAFVAKVEGLGLLARYEARRQRASGSRSNTPTLLPVNDALQR